MKDALLEMELTQDPENCLVQRCSEWVTFGKTDSQPVPQEADDAHVQGQAVRDGEVHGILPVLGGEEQERQADSRHSKLKSKDTAQVCPLRELICC